MTASGGRRLRSWLRDMSLGAAIFLLLPLLTLACPGQGQRWSFNDALAGDVGATLAIEMSSQAGPVAENALVSAALLSSSTLPDARRLTELAVLGFTFSLLVAFNLAFVRHLRRVCASPRRGVWRRRTQ